MKYSFSPKPKILALVAYKSTGKDIVSEVVQERGYLKRSFRDPVVAEARRRKLDYNQTSILQKIGRDLITETGNDAVWAERLVETMTAGGKYVVDGIRNPGEIDAFKEVGDCFLLGIYSPFELRRHWAVDFRKRAGEVLTYEGFRGMDWKDRGISMDEGGNIVKVLTGQNSETCFSLADRVILNIRSNSPGLEDGKDFLRYKIELFLDQWESINFHNNDQGLFRFAISK